MDRIALSLNIDDLKNPWATLGFDYILGALRGSNLFDISWHREKVTMERGYRATILKVNNKRIYLDFWEYPTPTYTIEAYRENFDLIIKLQHKIMTGDYIEAVCKKKGWLSSLTAEERKNYCNKIIPFTFFPSSMLLPFVEHEEKLFNHKIDLLGFFCGKVWKCRKSMLNRIQQAGMEIYSRDENKFSLTDQAFIEKMLRSKFGICLHGRGSHFTDFKNRREIDYMMMKKPLLLNYQPHYYHPLISGQHYILIDEKTNFEKLDSLYNVNAIVEEAFQWYCKNATPMGIANTFVEILKEKGIV